MLIGRKLLVLNDKELHNNAVVRHLLIDQTPTITASVTAANLLNRSRSQSLKHALMTRFNDRINVWESLLKEEMYVLIDTSSIRSKPGYSN